MWGIVQLSLRRLGRPLPRRVRAGCWVKEGADTRGHAAGEPPALPLPLLTPAVCTAGVTVTVALIGLEQDAYHTYKSAMTAIRVLILQA